MAGATPFSDFLASLADPAMLERYQLDAVNLIRSHGLTETQEAALLSGNRGAIRMEGVRELEAAGLSPIVSDKVPTGSAMEPITINTNNFDTTHIDIHTFDTTTYNTTHDNTTQVTSKSDWRAEMEIRIVDAIRYFSDFAPEQFGSLLVVGSGIKPLSDMTSDARAQISRADVVLYCVADPATEREIHRLNPRSTSLYGLYGNDKPRIETYKEMVDAIMAEVRNGQNVCAVFYGHPGIFAWSPHVAISTARAEGYRAEMRPGISAQDALVADLGIDPSTCGMQTMDATEFLVHARALDTYSHVLIWQAECVGDEGFNFGGYSRRNFPLLVERLLQFYPADHNLFVYDASTTHFLPPQIQRTTVGAVEASDLTGISTLYLPPVGTPPIDDRIVELLLAP
jgi:precorrin-6B methylase 1